MAEKELFFKEILSTALKENQLIKVNFVYPGNEKPFAKRGQIIKVEDGGFTMMELHDGECSFSYDFVVEILIITDASLGVIG